MNIIKNTLLSAALLAVSATAMAYDKDIPAPRHTPSVSQAQDASSANGASVVDAGN